MRPRPKRICGSPTACEMEATHVPPDGLDWCPVLRIELCTPWQFCHGAHLCVTEYMIHMTSDPQTLQLALYDRIATELTLKREQVQRTVALLLDDATVPFIARYRKEATGNLDEEQIRHIEERHK